MPGLPHQAPPPPGRALRSHIPSQQQPVSLNFRDIIRKCDDYKLKHSKVPWTWGKSCGWRTQGGCGVVHGKRLSWNEGLPGSQMPREECSVDPTRGRLGKPRRETQRVTRRPLVPGPVWAVMCFSVYVLAPQGIPWWSCCYSCFTDCETEAGRSSVALSLVQEQGSEVTLTEQVLGLTDQLWASAG